MHAQIIKQRRRNIKKKKQNKEEMNINVKRQEAPPAEHQGWLAIFYFLS